MIDEKIAKELADLDSLKSNPAESVALELMKIIANAESKQPQGQEFPREYYLRLYAKCIKTVVLRNYEGWLFLMIFR